MSRRRPRRQHRSSVGAILGICLLVAAGHAASQDDGAEAFLTWARTNARPLRTVEPAADTADLQALGRIIGDARVIALGEPAHGAHEPLTLRNRIIQYLVQERGVTAVALETAFTESRAVNDYVGGAPGNAVDVVRQNFSWGFGRFGENVQLIEWLREHNRDANRSRKVRLYGIDLSGADERGGFSRSRVALDEVLRFLERVDEAQSRRARLAVMAHLASFSDRDYAQLGVTQDAAFEREIEDLAAYFHEHERAITLASSHEQYAWMLHNIAVARELQRMFRLGPPPSAGSPIRPEDWKSVNVRDAAMAANVRWVLDQEGPGARVLVFAHNAHVMNASPHGGIWSAFAASPTMMGQHLRRDLGATVRIVGTIAASNDAGLPPAFPLPGSAEDLLANLHVQTLLLNLRDAAGNAEVSRWLSQERPLRANFSTQLDVPLGSAFDALIFQDHVTPARPDEGISVGK